MKNKFIKAAAVSMILVMAMPVKAQDPMDLGAILQDLVSTNATSYLAPAVTALGSGFNSGTFHLGKPHKLLGFDFKISIMAVEIPEMDQTYIFELSDLTVDIDNIPNPIGGGTLTLPLAASDIYQSGIEVPTMMGQDVADPHIPVNTTGAYNAIVSALATELNTTTANVEALGGTQITSFVDGLPKFYTGEGLLPGIGGAIVPQFSVGLPFHTELTVRGFSGTIPNTEISFELTGFGVKLGLNQFLPNLFWLMPALSVGYYETNVNIADIITMDNSIINFQASKSLPFISVYAGYGMESTMMNIDLSDKIPGASLEPFSIEGLNTSRTTVGFRLKLLLLSINGDMSTGEYTTFTLGVGLTLR